MRIEQLSHHSLTCEFEYSISDADFGLWHPSFGPPDVHTFACGDPAAFLVTSEHHDGKMLVITETAICQHHMDGGE